MTDRWQSVLAALRERFPADAEADELSAFLAAEGYDGRQIGEIVARFRVDDVDPRRAAGRGRAAADTAAPLASLPLPPLRVLGPHEAGRFERDAWGRLVGLHAGGALNLLELEQVIERALLHGEGAIGSAELGAILESFGLGDLHDDRDPVTIH